MNKKPKRTEEAYSYKQSSILYEMSTKNDTRIFKKKNTLKIIEI